MRRSRINELAHGISQIPLVLWILAAFMISYLFLVIEPVFLSSGSMQFFQPAPAAEHLGIDLKMRLSWSAYSLNPIGMLPDGDGTVFPPFANLLFAPLLGLQFPAAYALLTVLTVVSYGALTLVLPFRIARQSGPTAVAALIGTAGLMSYGMLFELERGQWNVIAMGLTLLAIWLFHRHTGLRFLAFTLITLAIQLKVYPVVFLPLLVADWRRWRDSLRPIALLGGANLLLLFVQGTRSLRIWLLGLSAWSAETWIWEGNPSIRSAVTLGAEFAGRQGSTGLAGMSEILSGVLSLIVVLCLVAILVYASRTHGAGPSAHYLLAAAIGCLLIPSGGYDYRLSILGGPLVLLFLVEDAAYPATKGPWGLLMRRLSIFLVALAYSSTLVPFDQKPFYLANNFPALFLMLLIVTALALTSGVRGRSAAEATDVHAIGPS